MGEISDQIYNNILQNDNYCPKATETNTSFHIKASDYTPHNNPIYKENISRTEKHYKLNPFFVDKIPEKPDPIKMAITVIKTFNGSLHPTHRII